MITSLLWLLISINTINTLQTIKEVSISPTNPSLNGVSTNILIPSDVTTTTSEWQIKVSTQKNYHLKLSLNNNWRFDSLIPSSIQIQINSNTLLSSINDLDLIFTFSVSLREYFTIILRMDNNNDNWIYPYCDQSLTNKMKSGNVQNIMNNNTYSSRIMNIANGNIDNFKDIEPQNYNHFNNEFPIIFNIFHHPIDNYIIFKYYNPSMNTFEYQSCGFAMNNGSDSLFDVFISADGNNEAFNITSFDILYTMNININDTESQTNQPSYTTTNVFNDIFKQTNETIMKQDAYVKDDIFSSFINLSIGNSMLYLLIIPCSCLCIICIISLCLASKIANKPNSKLENTDIKLTVTGVCDYNNVVSPRDSHSHSNSNKNNNNNNIKHLRTPDQAIFLKNDPSSSISSYTSYVDEINNTNQAQIVPDDSISDQNNKKITFKILNISQQIHDNIDKEFKEFKESNKQISTALPRKMRHRKQPNFPQIKSLEKNEEKSINYCVKSIKSVSAKPYKTKIHTLPKHGQKTHQKDISFNTHLGNTAFEQTALMDDLIIEMENDHDGDAF